MLGLAPGAGDEAHEHVGLPHLQRMREAEVRRDADGDGDEVRIETAGAAGFFTGARMGVAAEGMAADDRAGASTVDVDVPRADLPDRPFDPRRKTSSAG